jgi:hypothetical protein
MIHLKKSYTLLMLLTVIISSRTFAQDLSSWNFLARTETSPRALDVIRDNEYTTTGFENGNFYRNPLLLDGRLLDYTRFSLESKGELTVIKGAAVTGNTVQVPFYVYLRRDGNKVVLPGNEKCSKGQDKIEISEILKHAKPGDELIIEPVNKEDGPAKRILKLLSAGGC